MLSKKEKNAKFTEIDVNKISPAPFQPRQVFDEEKLAALARSIAENGLLIPISVRKKEGGYELIAGERRLMAFKLLGKAKIPAIIENVDDTKSAVFTIIENLHREGLNPFEEAEGIKSLLVKTGLPQNKICIALDMPQSTVANKLRLLKLGEDVRQAVLKYSLGERTARAILRLPEEKRLRAAEYIGKNRLSSAEAEEYIEERISKDSRKRKQKIVVGDYKIMFSALDKAVAQFKSIGISAVTSKSYEGDYLIYKVKLPKPLE